MSSDVNSKCDNQRGGWRSNVEALFLALIVFLDSVWFMPHEVLVAAVLVLAFLYHKRVRLRPVDLLLVVFVIWAFLNGGVGILTERMESLTDVAYVMTSGLYLLVPLLGRYLPRQFRECLLYFICFEACVAIVEGATQRPYLTAGQGQQLMNAQMNWGETDLMYYNRVFGLSNNSSVCALKLMIGIILLDGARLGRVLKMACTLILCGGLIVTFNRTVIASLGLYLLFRFFVIDARKRWIAAGVAAVGTTLAVVFLLGSSDLLPELERQFLRGHETIDNDVDIRNHIWSQALQFIMDNPVFGNRSLRFYTEIHGDLGHTHNSYLQMVATHGILGILPILYPLLLIRRKTLAVIVAFFAFSLTQYGLFWYVSMLDIVLYFLLADGSRETRECRSDALGVAASQRAYQSAA